MKKIFFALFGATTLWSCSPKMSPLTSITTDPVMVESTLSKEAVWEKLVDHMAVVGTTIKLIDKASGLIVTDDYSFINSWTYENKKGVQKNPSAFVAIKKRGGRAPQTITGQWNARVKDKPGGGSIININLVNLKAYRVDVSKYGSSYTNYSVGSNQVFEKAMADKIK